MGNSTGGLRDFIHWCNLSSFNIEIASAGVVFGQRPIGRDGMELLGNQQVDIFVMLLKGGQAVGIPAHEKCSSHRIIAGRELSDVRHAPAAAFTSKRFLF